MRVRRLVEYKRGILNRKGELRRHERSITSAPVRITWQDQRGMDNFVNGRTLDISASGLRIEVPEPIVKQTRVTLQCAELWVHGTASVRSCTRKGMKYVVGLELSSGVQLKPKR